MAESPVVTEKPVLQLKAPKQISDDRVIERVNNLADVNSHQAVLEMSQAEVEQAQDKINQTKSPPEIKMDPTMEVKPRETGILAKSLTAEQKRDLPKVKYLMVFGQGPVQDPVSKTKDGPASLGPGNTAEANSWMRTNARAAAELKLAGATEKIVLTGGKTGAAGTPSEAALMREILVNEYGISDDDIILEDKATNTLQNFSLGLNTLHEQSGGNLDKSQIGFLGSHFHLARIRDLGHLYGIDSQNAFSAEMIMDYIADLDMDKDPSYNRQLQNLIRRRLEIDEDQSHYSRLPDELRKKIPFQSRLKEEDTYFAKQLTEEQKKEGKQNEEAKGSMDRLMIEKLTTRGLLEEPGYWAGYAFFLNDPLLTDWIKNQAPETLGYLGVNDQMKLATVREKLYPYTVALDKGGKRTSFDAAFGKDKLYDDYSYATALNLGRIATDLNQKDKKEAV